MNGIVRPRSGNRMSGYLQGVYPTVDEDVWVALSLPDEGTLDHDMFDELVAGWTRTQSATAVVEGLRAQGIPAEQLATGDRMYDFAQLDARRFYEEFTHPVTGPRRYPGWPFRITPGPARHHRSGAPTLGWHNDEILRGLGLSATTWPPCGKQRVIGERVLGG